MRITYQWDASKAYINGTYTLTRDGKPAGGGRHIIGHNPALGVRAWVFDNSGVTGNSVWEPDGKTWLIAADGTLPDGSSLTATNVLVPLGPDAFTWQPTNRFAHGVPLPDQPPVKVTRVKPSR